MILCGIIAATAGPSSATLFIPREMLWKLPSSYVAINGSFSDIWPDRLDPLQIPQKCSFLAQSHQNSLYLAAKWQGIYETFKSFVSYVGKDFNRPGGVITGDAYVVQSATGATISGLFVSCPTEGLGGLSPQICGTAQPGITTALFDDIYSYQTQKTTYLDLYHSADKSAYAAFSAIQCLSDTIDGPGDTRPLQFPHLLRTPEEYSGPNVGAAVEEPKRTEIYSNVDGNLSESRLVWTSLPTSEFGTGVQGAVVLDPRNSTYGSYQTYHNMYSCCWVGNILNSYRQRQSQQNLYLSSTPSTFFQQPPG